MKMKGAMDKRNNAMAGVGDENRIAVTNHEIRSEQEQDQVNLNRDVAVWVAKNKRTEVWAVGLLGHKRQMDWLPLWLEELDAMRTVRDDELLSRVVVVPSTAMDANFFLVGSREASLVDGEGGSVEYFREILGEERWI
ncbi:hypothetical protein Tco_0099022 [Tanacetum coccineum]